MNGRMDAGSRLRAFIGKQRAKWSPQDFSLRLDGLGSRPGELGPYYVSLNKKVPDLRAVASEPLVRIKVPEVTAAFVHPVATCHRALALYERWFDTGDPEYHLAFLKVAELFLSSGERVRSCAKVWLYPAGYGSTSKSAWWSGMAQGLALAVTARAMEVPGRKSHFESLGYEIFESFKSPISDGGVVADDMARCGAFYEEYAVSGAGNQFHTLNGMTAALFGIWDFAGQTGNPDVRSAFDNGALAVRQNLTQYDFPFCSSYDLRHVVARRRPLFNARYNAVHVAHLQVLAKLTGDKYFEGVANCWDRKLRDGVNRFRMLLAYIRWKSGSILRLE